MKAKALTALLAVAVIALAATAWHQNRTIGDLRAQLAANTTSTPPITAQSRNVPVPDGATAVVATPTSANAPSHAPTPTPTGPKGATLAGHTGEDPDRRRVMRDFAKMLENPQMNEVMQASQRATLEVLYKDLLADLQLSPEEQKHLMDLLMARQMFRVETSMKMMGGNNDATEMEALADEMKEYDKLVRAEIDTFLNNREDVATFEFYEKTMGERMALSGLKAELASAQIPLGDQTQRQLIDMMARQKSAHRFRSDLADETNYDMNASRFSADNINALELDLTELHGAIATEARTILTEEQLAAFTRTLEQMRQMQVSQMRMAANMFAGPPKGQ